MPSPGRGRAKDSKCVLVTSKKEQEEKERYNLQKEEMMNKAIEAVQNWDEKIFAKKVSNFLMWASLMSHSAEGENSVL